MTHTVYHYSLLIPFITIICSEQCTWVMFIHKYTQPQTVAQVFEDMWVNSQCSSSYLRLLSFSWIAQPRTAIQKSAVSVARPYSLSQLCLLLLFAASFTKGLSGRKHRLMPIWIRTVNGVECRRHWSSDSLNGTEDSLVQFEYKYRVPLQTVIRPLHLTYSLISLRM